VTTFFLHGSYSPVPLPGTSLPRYLYSGYDCMVLWLLVRFVFAQETQILSTLSVLLCLQQRYDDVITSFFGSLTTLKTTSWRRIPVSSSFINQFPYTTAAAPLVPCQTVVHFEERNLDVPPRLQGRLIFQHHGSPRSHVRPPPPPNYRRRRRLPSFHPRALDPGPFVRGSVYIKNPRLFNSVVLPGYLDDQFVHGLMFPPDSCHLLSTFRPTLLRFL